MQCIIRIMSIGLSSHIHIIHTRTSLRCWGIFRNHLLSTCYECRQLTYWTNLKNAHCIRMTYTIIPNENPKNAMLAVQSTAAQYIYNQRATSPVAFCLANANVSHIWLMQQIAHSNCLFSAEAMVHNVVVSGCNIITWWAGPRHPNKSFQLFILSPKYTYIAQFSVVSCVVLYMYWATSTGTGYQVFHCTSVLYPYRATDYTR